MIGILGDSVVLESLLDRATCLVIKDYVFIINDCIKNYSLVLARFYCECECVFTK